MKKTILTSVLSSIFFLFLVNVVVAQSESTPIDGAIVEFLDVKNETKLPAVVAEKLHADIKKHVKTWNRLTVIADIPVQDIPDMMPSKRKDVKSAPAVERKPAPTKEPSTVPPTSVPTTTQKPNTLALVKITDFKTGKGAAFPGSGDNASSGKQKAGVRAQIKGVVLFRVKGGDKVVEKVEFNGDYVISPEDKAAASGQNVSSGNDGRTSASKSGKKQSTVSPSRALKKQLLKEVSARALADFVKKAKYAFTSDFEIIRVLEGKSDDALTVEMNGGKMQDVKQGYQYNLYVNKPIGPKQTTQLEVGTLKVLQTGGSKSIAKIMYGGKMVSKLLQGENKKAVYANLIESTEQ